MNRAQIQEWFIRAAEIDRHDPQHVGPKQPRSLDLPYTHDYADKAGWGTKGLEEERRLFWEKLQLRASSHEITQVEKMYSWLQAVGNDQQRRALLAWARAKAGGISFNRWCFKVEDIHPETGRRRKDRAIEAICRHLGSSGSQHCENGRNGELASGGEVPHKHGIIENAARPEDRGRVWRDPAFQSLLSSDVEPDFSWAEKRNELRRRRRKLRQQQEKKGKKNLYA